MINRTIFATALLAAAISARTQTVKAVADYVIEDQNGYTYSDTGTYMNFGVVTGGGIQYKSFMVLDFDATSLGPTAMLVSAGVSMEESCYHSTSPSNLKFWVVPNTTTNLHKGQTTVLYDDTVVGGYSGQLGAPTLLSSFAFTSNSNGNASGNINQVDAIRFALGFTKDGQNAILKEINSSNHIVRILVTTDETGYATYYGAGTLSAYLPQLNLITIPVQRGGVTAGPGGTH